MAQEFPRIDSVKQALSHPIGYSDRFELLRTITRYYLEVNYDSSLFYGKQVYELSSGQSPKAQAIALDLMGGVMWRRANAAIALELYFKAQAIAESLKDTALLSTVLYDIGNAYNSQSDIEKAIHYYTRSLQLVPPLGHFIGSDYTRVRALMNLGEQYLFSNKLDSAQYYVQKAYNIQVSLQEDRKKYLSTTSHLLGIIQEKKGKISAALAMYGQGIKFGYSYSNLNAVSSSYLAMASLFQTMQVEDSAYLYGTRAFRVAQQVNNLFSVSKASRFLHDLFKRRGMLDSAYNYQSIVLGANDSLLNIEKLRQVQNISFNEQLRRQEVVTQQEAYQSKIRLFVLLGMGLLFLTIAILLYRNNKVKQKAYALLQSQMAETNQQKEKVEQTLLELKSTQAQLLQKEKMASLGELTAGIAHEIQNPLNFVNNFSAVNTELLAEATLELSRGNITEVATILSDIEKNETKIHHHGKRADSIVKGMLQHASASSDEKQPTDINRLVEEYLRLSYQGIRAKDQAFGAAVETHFDDSISAVNIAPQDIGRVLLNLFNNAFYAVQQKKQQLNGMFEPVISVSTKRTDKQVVIIVRDNGTGMAPKVAEKVFQPFFTTKPTGEGTGLGLSLSYDIVSKGHGGELKVEAKEGEGAEFVITLPATQIPGKNMDGEMK
jgi:signal transduction histidine kinase